MVNLEQKIKITWGNNRLHYESKGYKYSKKGNEFFAKAYELPENSLKQIDVICDYCGNLFTMTYCNYNRSKRNCVIDKDACPKCVKYKRNESNIKKYGGKSFNCTNIDIDDLRKQFLRRDMILLSDPEFITYNTILEYSCNKHSDFKAKITYDSFKHGHGCYLCGIEKSSSKRRIPYAKVYETFRSRNYELISDNYIGCHIPLSYICNKHKENGIQQISYSSLCSGKGCWYCSYELRSKLFRKSYSQVKKEFEKRDCILLTPKYINARQNLEFICNKHKKEGVQNTTYMSFVNTKYGCHFCDLEKRTGENNCNWNGGITEINRYLRYRMLDWKKSTMKSSNYKCVITGDRFDDIHHLHGFDQILAETLEITGLEPKTIGEYTQEELDYLTFVCTDLHKKYGDGCCLRGDIHTLFHHEYLYGNNTPQQFEEFKQRYLAGEFDEQLKSM